MEKIISHKTDKSLSNGGLDKGETQETTEKEKAKHLAEEVKKELVAKHDKLKSLEVEFINLQKGSAEMGIEDRYVFNIYAPSLELPETTILIVELDIHSLKKGIYTSLDRFDIDYE